MTHQERVLSSGTATFLFTDIEGSTRLLERLGPGYSDVLLRHRQLLQAVVESHGGVVVGHEGDALFVAFTSAAEAAAAAVDAQCALASEPWPDGAAVRVRMGLHTGEATVVGDNDVGMAVHVDVLHDDLPSDTRSSAQAAGIHHDLGSAASLALSALGPLGR